MFELGQDWKIAALRISKCVCFFYRNMGDIMNDEYYMRIAIHLANKAYKKNEVPVGAIIVKNDKIISKAYNRKETRKNPIHHAEIIAIEKACKREKTWHLDDCILYTTLEPCMMCAGAIEQSRIKKVVYGTQNYNYGYISHLTSIESKNMKKEECILLLKKFFKSKR